MAHCHWPQHPPPSSWSHAGLAGRLPGWGWHKSPASRDGGLRAAGSSGGSTPPRPSPIQELGHYRHLRLAGCPSHLRLHLLQGNLAPGPGPPMASTPCSSLSSLDTGLPLPTWPSCMCATAFLSMPRTSLCSHPGMPVPADPQRSPDYWASRAISLGQLRWSSQPTASHQRNKHRQPAGPSRSHTHVFSKEGLLLLRVLGLLGLLHLQALDEGCSLRAKHEREGTR